MDTTLRIGISRRAILAGAGATMLAACSSSSTGGSTGSAASASLRLQNWFTSTDMSAWNIGLDAVKAKYAGMGDVKLEFVEYNSTISKTMAEATARNMPDLIMASNNHVPSLSANGLLLNLDPYIQKSPAINADDFAPGVSQGFHLNGHWWGFPYDNTTFGIFYNTTLFQKAGVQPPPGSGVAWTWDELITAAKALTDPSKNQWGLYWWTTGRDPWDQYLASNFIYSAGGRNFSDDLRKCVINSPESTRALQYMVDLIHVHKVAPTPAQTAGNAVDYFQTGHAAMYFDGSYGIQPRLKTTEFPFDVGLFPLDKQKRVVTGGSGFCISATTKNPDACWNWLSEFTSTEVLSEMIGATGRGIPARKSAAGAFSKTFSKVPHASAFIDELPITFNDRSVLAYDEFLNSYNRALEPIFRSGQGDIASALDTVARETNAALDAAWSQVKK